MHLRLIVLVFVVFTGLFSTAPVYAADDAGTLRVSASVKGAKVFLNGEEIGVTPLSQAVPAGQHELRVVADYFDPFVRRVRVEPDRTMTVEARLRSGRGTVEFVTQPRGVTVSVDGRSLGKAPIRVTDLPAGKHRYRLERDGFETVDGRFEFQEGKNLLITASLDSSDGLFVVETTPPGATVELDGVVVGQTPFRQTDLPRGVHTLRVSLEGHATSFRRYDTSQGGKAEFTARLFEDASRVLIRTGHKEAKVFVEGHFVGQGRTVDLGPVQRGKYELQVSAPGLKTLTEKVLVPTIGRTEIRVKLSEENGRGELVMLPPITSRWSFWVAASVVASASVPATMAVVAANEPEEQPSGDLTVVVP